ncbi:MAG: hypothetical protein WC775_02470 [Patescibacteria group bacterium]|jgi:hypothetical protein
MLTEKEKNRLKEEEAYRTKLREEAEYRKTVRHEQEHKSTNIPETKRISSNMSSKSFAIRTVVIIVALVVVARLFHPGGSSVDITTTLPTNTPSPTPEPLDGTVNYKDMQIVISNNGTENWVKCKFTLNSDYRYPTGYYKYTENIEPGVPFHINITNFVKNNSERFNTYFYKVASLFADCNGRIGYWNW